jgi:general stress protein YciG
MALVLSPGRKETVMSDQNAFKGQSPSSDTTPLNTGETAPATAPKRRRGFAVMDPDLVRKLAKKGGIAAHRAGTAHEFSSEEARAAGRKGGVASHRPAIDKTLPGV